MKDDNHFVINQRDNRQVAKRDRPNCSGKVRTGVSSIHGGWNKKKEEEEEEKEKEEEDK